MFLIIQLKAEWAYEQCNVSSLALPSWQGRQADKGCSFDEVSLSCSTLLQWGAQRPWLGSSTQACLSSIFEASLGSISPFYTPVCYAGSVWAARSQPGLQPIAGKPLVVPTGDTANRQNLPGVHLGNLVLGQVQRWNNSLSSQAAPQSIQALQLDRPWQPQKLTCKQTFPSEGGSKLYRLFLTHQRRNYNLQHLYHHSE